MSQPPALWEKINPLIRFSVQRYVFSVAVFLGLFGFGAVSMLNLGVDLMPSINIPVVVVNTSWPGASPDVMDRQVSQVIENAVSTLPGITDITARSQPGSSFVSVNFSTETDRNQAANQVSAAVAAVTRRLPSGVTPPTVRTFDPNAQAILTFGLYADGRSMTEVGEYLSNQLIPVLERVDGVANLQVDGNVSQSVQVWLKPENLALYGLNPQQVAAAISAASVNVPVGTVQQGGTSLTFAANTQPETVDDLLRLPVDSSRGITLAQVATVRETSAANGFARVNGRPAILVSVQKASDKNSVAVADKVYKALAGLRLPDGYHIQYSNDTTGPIRASIESAVKELILTSVVVALICLLFLGRLNTALSVILAIPIALAAGPILYTLAGFTFNLVSILALIIAIGIVVDDSIVISENVERYRLQGLSKKEAVLRGSSEVFSAVVAATLSLLAVLLPVSFIGGPTGRYIQQFTLGLSAAVLLSLIEALLFLSVRLTFTPDTVPPTWKALADRLGDVKGAWAWGLKFSLRPVGILVSLALLVLMWFTKLWALAALVVLSPVLWMLAYWAFSSLVLLLDLLTGIGHRGTEAVLGWIRDRYVRLLAKLLKPWKSTVLLLVLAAGFAATVAFLLPTIPFTFVPASDGGSLTVSLRLPGGASDQVTNQAAARLETALLARHEVKTVQTLVETGRGTANLVAVLVPVEERPSVFVLAPKWRAELGKLLTSDLPSARIQVSTGGFGGQGGGFGGGTLQLTLAAADFDKLKTNIFAIREAVTENQWVVDASTSLDDMKFQNNFVPNYNLLKTSGLSLQTVTSNLQVFGSGAQAGSLVRGGLSYPVTVSGDPSRLLGAQSLEDLRIFTAGGQGGLSVGQLGHFEMVESPTSLNRTNRQYSATVNLTLKPGAPPNLSLQATLAEDLTKRGLLGASGVDLTTGSQFGPAALASQLMNTMAVLFPLAFFLAYLVMASQFNSWRYPLYLLLPVPLALIGAFWFIFFAGGGWDLFALLGMLMLIGLSAKNAIIYLEFVMERIGRLPLTEALTEAAGLRFRPIVMTTLTVLVISFPLMFSSGQGSEFGQKLGVVMLGGVLSSAVLTFFVVPAAFFLFERKHQSQAEIEAVAIHSERD